MNWVNIQYKNNLRKYEKRDGLKALTTYCLIMCSAFFQGWLYTTNANVFVLNSSQIWIPLTLVAVFFCFFYCSKENIRSIGINSDNIKNSIVLGFLGGFVLLVMQTTLFMVQGKSVSFTTSPLLNWVIFLFAAFEEEILFRGFIQNYLFGLKCNKYLVFLIGALMFSIMHLPFQMYKNNNVSLTYIIEALPQLVFCFTFHLIMCFITCKRKDITIPTALHYAIDYLQSAL